MASTVRPTSDRAPSGRDAALLGGREVLVVSGTRAPELPTDVGRPTAPAVSAVRRSPPAAAALSPSRAACTGTQPAIEGRASPSATCPAGRSCTGSASPSTPVDTSRSWGGPAPATRRSAKRCMTAFWPRGTAVLTVAHRLATARDADHVLLVSGGHPEQQCDPAILLTRESRSADLAALEQAGWDWQEKPDTPSDDDMSGSALHRPRHRQG
jgi:hypothetical protein